MVTTKIICTLGPSSSNQTILRKMMQAGMDVARFNFSHGTHQDHNRRILLVRTLNRKYRRHIRLLGDLEGYRIRVGRLKNGKPVELKKRQILWLTQKDSIGEGNIIPFDYHGSLSVIAPGQHVYIDDGNIALVVKDRLKKCLKTEVIRPSLLRERKGINMPGAILQFEGLSKKDAQDIDFCIKKKLDYIAQSFIRTKHDILKIRGLIKDNLPDCKIIAKIENQQGICNIDEIIDVSDGIMIARGDMGISVPIYEIPLIQKNIIRKCNQKRKLVITATQMLESMTEHPLPTRAEVTDVANAIIDGSNYLMLSAETASGSYPAETVTMMNQIIKFTEAHYRKK